MATKKAIGYLFAVRWMYPANRVEKAPGGVHVKAIYFSRERMSDAPEILQALHVPGDHYCISHSFPSAPTRPMSPEARASMRRKRLERRAKAKYPLFADQIVAEELARKTSYYNGVTDEVIARDYEHELELEQQSWNWLNDHAEELIHWNSIPDFVKELNGWL